MQRHLLACLRSNLACPPPVSRPHLTLWHVLLGPALPHLPQGSIYGYDAHIGTMNLSFKDLHQMPITCMLYLADSDTLITTTSDSSATVR